MDIVELENLIGSKHSCSYIALIAEREQKSTYKIGEVSPVSKRRVKIEEMQEVVYLGRSSMSHAIYLILDEYSIILGEKNKGFVKTSDIHKYIQLAEFITNTYDAYRTANKKKLETALLSEDMLSIMEKCLHSINDDDRYQ